MINQSTDHSVRSAAVIGGASLVGMALAAIFSVGFVLDALIVPGDAAATVTQIQASETLFRAGIFGWLLILLLDVIVAWALHVFLRRVNPNLSLLTAWLRLVYAAILGIGLSNLVGVLFLLRGGDSLTSFDPEQIQAGIMLLINMFYGAWETIGLVVFGCHLFLLGYLVIKSGYVPRVIGFLIVLASFGYIITNSGNLLFPQYASYIATIETVFVLPMIVGELGLGLWLLVRGGRGESASRVNASRSSQQISQAVSQG
ncbi:MAG: DUF4386 domain-containing protein [Chloroflexota bacterium]